MNVSPAPSILASRVSELPQMPKSITSEAGSNVKNSLFSKLMHGLGEVNSIQAEASEAISSVASGESQDLHGTMIALEKAGIALKFTNQLRNKCIEAYQEIMRMQV